MCWQRIYSNSSLWGEISMVNLGYSSHSSMFTLLKHLMMLLKYNFYTLPKTLIPFTTIQFRFFFESENMPLIFYIYLQLSHYVNAKIFYTLWILTLSDMTRSFKEEIGTEYCRDFENARNRSIKRVSFSENSFLTPYYKCTCTCISRLLFMIFLSLSLLTRSWL